MAFIYILVFILGTALGSFFSVLISRLDIKKGTWLGRSECPNCQRVLGWRDLFPLISFIILKGRCRYCRSKISWSYPILELVSGLVLVLAFINLGTELGPEFIFEVVFSMIFLTLVFFDAFYMILPDKIIFPAIGTAIIFNFLYQRNEFWQLLLTGFSFAVFFAIIHLVSKGKWMGFGDVKLVFLVGIVLGYPLAFWTIIFSIWSAALFGMTLIILRKADLQTAIPFGSFISSVSIIFIIFGNVIEQKIRFISQIF